MKTLKSTLLTLAALLCSTVASAYDFEVDGIFYNITDSYNFTVEVTYENNSYTGDVVIPSTVTYNNEVYSVTSIGSSSFSGCSSLASITIPNSVTSIGNYAFDGCKGLKNLIVEDGDNDLLLGYANNVIVNNVKLGLFRELPLESVYLGRNIISNALFMDYFGSCHNLKSVVIGNTVTNIPDFTFRDCSSLASITIPESVTSIGIDAFSGCSSLVSITIPSSMISIGDEAFYNCSNLALITIPSSVTSIGERAFYGIKEIVLKPTTPPVLTSSSSLVSDYAVITVPKGTYNDYSEADYWKDILAYITIDDANARVRNLVLTAEADKSALHMALGDEGVKFVTNLTISGTINSYDFMIMRNKMPVLRHLNLKDAHIVGNEYEHYTGYRTEDNKFPGYGLYNCKLFSFTFPESITSVGDHGVAENNYLSEVTVPEGVTSIDYDAFYGCDALASIALPEGVTSIGGCAFQYCSALESVVLPPTVTTIGWSAFRGCNKLKEIRIPSSVRTVGDYAFDECTSLNDVYVYTVEPFNIVENTFPMTDNNFISTLHAPKVSYWDYYYATVWCQFTSFTEFDEPYENFYLVGDKELDNETGAIEGEGDKAPDAEMGNNSGIIVEDDVVQDLGDVDINHDGTDGGSIIVDGSGCVNADKLHFHINVQGGRWYFFCFPFDVRKEDIKLENGADWVFRYYDGEERASNGKGGWKNVTSDGNGNHLKAATGYIFQCSQDDVLILTAKNQKIKQEKKYNELVEHVTENMHDASWNFVGNPYLSYYEVTSNDYSAPITVWDGEKYIAIRPGDDDYQLAPFEAFFVQKPTGVDEIEYSPGQQMTYHQSQEAAAKARARRRAMPINPDRLLVNITLSNGTDTDQTRVVFNNDAAMGYETACDAAKFSTAGVPQLYTIDSRAVKYAINERPVAEGIVTLGYSVPAQGNYTLAAPRMDTPVAVKDNLTGTIHNFAEGDYTFMSEAGTFEGRFTIMMKAGETGIENSEFNIENSELYNVKGQRVENADEQGIYIKNNRKVVSL